MTASGNRNPVLPERFAWPENDHHTPLSEHQATALAAPLAALGEPVRLRIVSLLSSRAPRPMTVTELTEALDLAQATVSHHLRVLADAGLVNIERSGNWRLYRCDTTVLRQVVERIRVS